MKKLFLSLSLLLIFGSASFAQTDASDFTIKMTDGNTQVLYSKLATNTTVMLDFFFVTCSYCIQYAPIIDAAYVDHGSGSGNFEIWGIDNGDNDASVIAYKSAHGVTNPCASGAEGSADAVTTTYTSGTYGTFTGWPTYTLICPDKHVFWDVNYPPSQTGFDTYINQCATDHSVSTAVSNAPKDLYTKIYSSSPNPADDVATISFGMGDASDVVFEVYNLLGAKVMTCDAGTLGGGYHNFQLPVSSLSNGTYFVKMMADNNRYDKIQICVSR